MSANAGSGKTHVLVQRVIRLLLAGVPPEKILCLTFTKAAAANMAERVFTTLGHWVTLDDDALDAAIRDVGIAHPTATLRKSARELFASALETPGGLKVQTIHALCTRLLQQFPFEANVPARFAVLDDRDQTEMMERASLAVLLDAAARPRQRDRPRAADRDGERRRRHFQGSRARGHASAAIDFMAWTERRRQRRRCRREISARSALTADDTIEDDRTRDRRGAEPAAIGVGGDRRALETGSEDRARQRALRARARRAGRGAGRRISRLFLTDTEVAAAQIIVTKNFVRDNPAYREELRRRSRTGSAADREAPRRHRRATDRGVAALSRSRSPPTTGAKRTARGLLDYDDLIDKTLALLGAARQAGCTTSSIAASITC